MFAAPFFRNSHFGNHLYEKCSTFHDTLPTDTWNARFNSSCKQVINLMVAKNCFGVGNLFGLYSYISMTERGEYINWYSLSLKFRKSKDFTPFQHAESAFLRRPSVFQLQGSASKSSFSDMSRFYQI